MVIVVNHLTRMQKGFMCVAGLNLDTLAHVRPMLRQQMRTRFLVRNGGPFDIGCVVDLGRTRPIGQPPETEDQLFFAKNASRRDCLPADQFWQLLTRVAKGKLGEIFGKDLVQRGRESYAVDVGHGTASLGCLTTHNRPHLIVQQKEGRQRIRMAFHIGDFPFNLGVTDIRLYAADHVTPNHEVIYRTEQRLQAAGEVILSVGLTRAFKKTADTPALHWLQVNNIHFQDDPCWQLR
jgi:hypothetical protein